jgi:hypothetical protein
MLTQPQVQRFAMESGLRDIMIAEKEVVLRFFSSFFRSADCLIGLPSKAEPVCGK